MNWSVIPVDAYYDKEALLRASIKPEDTVLDLGFWGQAHTADKTTWPHRIIQDITPHVWGVDLVYDDAALKNKERYQRANVESFEFKEKFDVILALDLIEHVTNVGLMLDQAKKHLAPGGKLIVSTPNAFNLFVLAGKLSRSEPPTNSDHTAYFNRPTLNTLFEKCGWGIRKFGVLYTLGDLHTESLKKKILNGIYWLLSKRTKKFYETLVVIATPD